MSYRLFYHPDVYRVDIRQIDARMRGVIEKAISERLQAEPERFGLSLRGGLKGFKRLRVANYRVVYSIAGEEVWIYGIIQRSRLGKKPGKLRKRSEDEIDATDLKLAIKKTTGFESWAKISKHISHRRKIYR